LYFERIQADYYEIVSKDKRIDYDNYSRACILDARTHARACATKKLEEKLNGREIRTTVLYRSVGEIPFGIDKTDGSHAQRTWKSKWDLRHVPYRTVP
jgi:hypothetical protein